MPSGRVRPRCSLSSKTILFIFRKTMPEHLINWGGAPSQGAEEEQTQAD